MEGKHPIVTEAGMFEACENEFHGGIFSDYNISYRNDEEVKELYRKQFLHIKSQIETGKSVKKTPFPSVLAPFYPAMVNELAPQYWIKIVFPPYFKSADLEDINVSLNAFPVSNKSLSSRTLERRKELVGILPLQVSEGEYFLFPDKVDSANGKEYDFLPFSTGSTTENGTYTIKRGGLERFSTRELSDMIETLIDLFRSEMVVFNTMKMENIRNSVSMIEEFTAVLSSKIESNNFRLKETPAYLLIDSEETHNTIYATYWISNCHIAKSLPYGTRFRPLKSLPFAKDSCLLLKASTGGKTATGKDERLEAYKYALTTRDQLYSKKDIENFCRQKFGRKIQYVKVTLGVGVGHGLKEGLLRTLDVNLVPSEDCKELFDPVMQGELREELRKRSPELYNYRIVVMEKPPY
jgi:hypothetical protein